MEHYKHPNKVIYQFNILFHLVMLSFSVFQFFISSCSLIDVEIAIHFEIEC